MRFGVDESVAIRRSAAEVSRHVLRECRHRGADPYLDSSALPLLIPPNTVITRSCALEPGSTAPPTSGTHRPTP